MNFDDHAKKARGLFALPTSLNDHGAGLRSMDVTSAHALMSEGLVGKTVTACVTRAFDEEPIPWRGWMLTFEGGSSLFCGWVNQGHIAPNRIYYAFDLVR